MYLFEIEFIYHLSVNCFDQQPGDVVALRHGLMDEIQLTWCSWLKWNLRNNWEDAIAIVSPTIANASNGLHRPPERPDDVMNIFMSI